MDQLGVAGKTNGGQIVTLDRGTPCRDAHRLHSVGMIEYPVQGINDAIVVEKVHQQPVLFVLYHSITGAVADPTMMQPQDMASTIDHDRTNR